MPTLHRYTDRPGFYARGLTRGRPVAFALTAEGEQYLTEQLGLADGARFAGDTLKWLYKKGWAAPLEALPEGQALAIEEVAPLPALPPTLDGVIQLRLASMDHVLLDQSAADVARELAKTVASILGPLPLPVVIDTYRLLREGGHRAFDLRTYRRLLQVRGPRQQTFEMMNNHDLLPREIELQLDMGR